MKKEEKEVKKPKFRFKKFLLFILVLYIIGFGIYQFLLTPVKNIFISGNKYLTDQEIIDISKLSNYPSFFLTFKSSIKNKLMKNSYIKSATITKKIIGKVYIEVEENKPLFYYKYDKETILSDGRKVSLNKFSSPVLINKISDELLLDLIKNMNKIDNDVLLLISEIKYMPNDIDKERFLFIMNDGNYVYITLTKIKSINGYINILTTLENKKGILYLDSGNYFEIFK